MIAIGRAPVRISFGGGGSDLPAYYDGHGGFVVSAAIDRCCAAIVSPSADDAACEIEIGILGRPIGKQDQYAASFGGLNAITFAARNVIVEPLALPPGVERALEARLRLFATGRTRDSAGILRRQRARTERG